MNTTPSPDLSGGQFGFAFEDCDTRVLPAQRPGLFAVIQVDSHDVLLRLSRLFSNGSFQVLRQEQATFQPAVGAFAPGSAPVPSPADARHIAVRLADILSRFQRLAELHGAAVRAVATPAFRAIPNHPQLLKRLPRITRVALELISERDVARLICLGALRGRTPGQRTLVIDMAEELTSVILANAEEPLALWTLNLGTNRFVAAAGLQDGAQGRSSRSMGHSWRQQIQQTLSLGHLEAIRGVAGEAVLIRRYNPPTATASSAGAGAGPGAAAAAAIAGAVAATMLREIAVYLQIGVISHGTNGLNEGILWELAQALTASSIGNASARVALAPTPRAP